MSFFIWNVNVEEDLDWGDLGKNLRGTVMKKVNAKVMGEWRDKMLPRHFTRYAARKYKHDRRSPKYLQRKERLAQHGLAEDGGQIDNVLSGLFRELVLSFSVVRPFPTRVRFETQGPRYVTMQPKGGGLPFHWGETTTITTNEEKQMGQHLLNWLVEEIERAGKRKRKKTRL